MATFLLQRTLDILMLLGTGIYLFCNYKVTGDCFKFLEYQRTIWGHGSAYFGTGINSIVSKLNLGTDKDMLASVWIPSLAAIIFVTANLFYSIRKHKVCTRHISLCI